VCRLTRSEAKKKAVCKTALKTNWKLTMNKSNTNPNNFQLNSSPSRRELLERFAGGGK